MNALMLAETRRWRGSRAWSVPVAGLIFGILQFFVVWGTGSATGWDGLIAGTVLWATSLAQPVAALVLALTLIRERRARGGGAWWRPGDPLSAGLCRMLVCTVVVALTNVFVLIPATVLGLLQTPETFPASRLTALIAVLTLGGALLYPLYELLAARWGIAPVLVLSLVWTMTGVFTAESPTGAYLPPAWPVRALLPLLATHANGIALATDDPIRGESPIPAIAGTALLLALLTLTYLATGRSVARQAAAPRRKRETPTVVAPFTALPLDTVRRRRPRPLRAHLMTLRRTPVTRLAALAVVVQAFVVLSWSDPDYATGFAELMLVPIGAAVLGTISWTSSQDAWRATATTPHAIARLGLTNLLAQEIILTATILTTSTLTLVTAADPARLLRATTLSLTVGWMLLTATSWLALRWSPGAAAAVNGIGLTMSLVLGAGDLGETLWPTAPWAWAHLPPTLGWGTTTLVAALSLTIGSALAALTVRALKGWAVKG